MVEVRFSSKTGVRCAWQNCRQSIEKGSGEPLQLPPGWRTLVISSGSTSSRSRRLLDSSGPPGAFGTRISSDVQITEKC
jgi:hypothetical protein